MNWRPNRALQALEERFAARARAVQHDGAPEATFRAVVAALRDRLMLAELALERAGAVAVPTGGPALGAIYVAVRSHLTRAELAEWERLDAEINRLAGGGSG